MKAKLGQNIRFREQHKIQLEKGGIATIKPGDIAKVIRKIDETTGEILYLTGEAKGKSQNVKIEVDDSMDYDKIANEVLKMLNE